MELVTTQDDITVVLFASDFPRATKAITIASGAGLLTKGTVLGKITKGAASSAEIAAGNTGDGTLTLDETTPILAGAKAGVYKARVIRAALAQVGTTPAVPAQKALVELKDPDGNVLEVFDLPTSAGITISNHIKFAMVEGSTPFELGDGFDITIAAGSGKYAAYNASAINGTEKAVLILGENADDATSADVKAIAYVSGHFNTAALTGLDAAARVDFEGTAILLGTVV